MSNFNDANDLASELVFGRYYQSEEPCPKPERLVFVGGDSTAVVTAKEETHAEWAEAANTIHRLFNQGYDLGCDVNMSWNGRYDADGNPEPDNNYLPSSWLGNSALLDSHLRFFAARKLRVNGC